MTKRLQIGAEISYQGKEISSRDSDCKSRQEMLETGTGISNQGRDYKSVQKNIFLSIDVHTNYQNSWKIPTKEFSFC